MICYFYAFLSLSLYIYLYMEIAVHDQFKSVVVNIPFLKGTYFLTAILFYTYVGNCCSRMKLTLSFVQALKIIVPDVAGEYFT